MFAYFRITNNIFGACLNYLRTEALNLAGPDMLCVHYLFQIKCVDKLTELNVSSGNLALVAKVDSNELPLKK